MVARPSKGLIVFRCCSIPSVGVFDTELLGVIWGVMGISILGLAIAEAPSARVWEDSLRRFGASLIFGCV